MEFQIMKPHNAMKVTLLGIEYDSIKAVCRAHNCTRSEVDKAIAAQRAPRPRTHWAKPVEVNGVQYRSLHIAAEKLGMCRRSLAKWAAKNQRGCRFLDSDWEQHPGA